MRKRIINPASTSSMAESESDRDWLDLERIAVVEVTSEDNAFPVEAALLPGHEHGWRASAPGKQVVRLRFDEPQSVRYIKLYFREPGSARTQEFALRWSSDGGDSFQEIVRQQWNFSPSGAQDEVEEYTVDLQAVTDIELSIDPDISDETAIASLEALWLA